LNPYQRYFQSTGVTANAPAGVAPGAITMTVDGDGLVRPTAFNRALSSGLTFMDPGFERITAFRGVTSDVVGETYTGNLDLTWDGQLFGHNFQFSTGAKALIRDKSVNDTDYRYFPLTGQTYLLSSYPGLTSKLDAGRGQPFKPVSGLDLIAPD